MQVCISRFGSTRVPWFALAVTACAWVAGLSPAAANLNRPEALDVTLLRADAIFTATIDEIVPTHGDHYRVSIGDLAIVANRWSVAPPSFVLAAERLLPIERTARGADDDGIEAIRALPYRITLARGHRYLFFLSGGRHPGAPSDAATPFYEIDDFGRVVCGSGFVYGLSTMGLTCARPEDVVGEPLVESELRARLTSAVARARARRPDFASERDAHLEALDAPGSEGP
jgi:hypothetical protein